MATEILEQPKTELIKVDEAGALIISGLKEALPHNQKLRDLAVNAFTAVLDTCDGGEMNDELDKQLNDLIVRANSAIEKMEAKRKPGTQMMTRIAKIFTGFENEIETLKNSAQTHRNTWAKTKAEKARAAEQEILRKQNIDKEKINIKAETERQVRLAYQEKLYAFKSAAQNKFNGMTLETIDTITAYIKGLATSYPRDKFNELAVNVSTVYLDATEKAGIIFDTRAGLYDELSANFRENMEDIQHNLLNMIPSKKIELEHIAKSSKDEADRLRAEAKKREEEEAVRLLQESEAAKANDAETVKMNADIATTGTLFDTQSALAEVSHNTGKTRQGYSITVNSMAGWGAIMAFWLTKEGAKADYKTAGKKSLDQMKTFCEKHGHKTNEKVVHADVVYEEEFKAVAVKEK